MTHGTHSGLASLDLKDAKASDAKDEAMIRSLVEHMPGGFHATNSFVRRSIREPQSIRSRCFCLIIWCDKRCSECFCTSEDADSF